MNEKKTSRRFIVLPLVAVLLVACSTKTGVEGRVSLSADKKIPFGGVTVSLYDATLDAADPKALVSEIVTDEKGNYAFTEVKPGTYSLAMSAKISSLPADITDCTFPGFAVIGDWMIISGTTASGGGVTSAILQEQFSVSTGDMVRYNLDFECE